MHKYGIRTLQIKQKILPLCTSESGDFEKDAIGWTERNFRKKTINLGQLWVS